LESKTIEHKLKYIHYITKTRYEEETKDDTSESSINSDDEAEKILNKNGHKNEIARMLSGKTITSHSLNQAGEMIANG